MESVHGADMGSFHGAHVESLHGADTMETKEAKNFSQVSDEERLYKSSNSAKSQKWHR